MRNGLEKNVAEIKTNILCSKIFSRQWCCLCDNMETTVKPDKPMMTIYNGACAYHGRYLRIQTHTQNM